MLPADDGERSLAGDAGAAHFIWNPVRRIWEKNRKGFKFSFSLKKNVIKVLGFTESDPKQMAKITKSKQVFEP